MNNTIKYEVMYLVTDTLMQKEERLLPVSVTIFYFSFFAKLSDLGTKVIFRANDYDSF